MLAAALLAGCGAAVEAGSVGLPSGDAAKEEARAALLAYAAAINEGDVDKAGEIYDRDADFHWIDRGVIQYQDGEAAAESLRGLIAPGATATMTFGEIRTADLAPGAVLVSARYNYEMSYAGDDEGFSFGGWMTLAMVKRENGWRIAGGQAGPAAE